MTAHPPSSDLLDRPETPAIRDHLASCGACRARARLVRDLEPTASPGIEAARIAMDAARRSGAQRMSASVGSSPGRRWGPMLEPGRNVDRYVIEAQVGHGGMGTVYRVRHAELGTTHALKVMHGTWGPHAERFKREGRAQGRLHHEHVVRVTDTIEIDGVPALVMDYVDGPTLADWLDTHGRVELPELDRLAIGVMAGVEAAHRAGLVHRDLKPANVLLAAGPQGRVPRVTDFGLARVLDDPSHGGLTRPQMPMGTPAYMSPEQIRDARTADVRSDVFSLGAMLYELATGTRAFTGADTGELYDRIRAGEHLPSESRAPELPARVHAALRAALQVDPELRPQTVAELLALWQRVAAPDRAPDRTGAHWQSPVWAVLVAVAVAATVSVGVWALRTASPVTQASPTAAETLHVVRDVGLTQLTALPDSYQIYAFAPSPDGRRLAYGDSRGLWLQDLVGGQAVLVAPVGTLQNLDWFPDGERLMLSSQTTGTRVVAADGSGLAPLFDATGRMVRLSPDGRTLAWTDGSGLWVADLASGKRRRLRPLASTDQTAALAWSPTSRALAALHVSGAGETSWLEITAVDGSSSRAVLRDWRLISLGLGVLAWFDDDKLVYGLARGSKEMRGTELWVLPDAETAADSDASWPLHTVEGAAVTQGRAMGDRLVVARIEGQGVAYRVPFDSPQARVRLDDQGWDGIPVGWWSDTEALVSSGRAGGGVYRISTRTGAAERVVNRRPFPNHVDRVDDSIIGWFERDDHRMAAMQITVPEGQATELLAPYEVLSGKGGRKRVRCRPSGVCLVSEGTESCKFRWLDIEGGELSEPVLEVRSPGAWDLHPSDDRIAMVSGPPGHLSVIDLSTGVEVRSRISVENPSHVVWAPDGERVVITGVTESGPEPYSVIEVGVDGTQRTLWTHRSWYLYAPSISPDGSEVLVGAFTFDDDLWMLDGLPL